MMDWPKASEEKLIELCSSREHGNINLVLLHQEQISVGFLNLYTAL